MGFLTAKTKCRDCGHEQESVFPASADRAKLKCGKCGKMTSEAVEHLENQGPNLHGFKKEPTDG